MKTFFSNRIYKNTLEFDIVNTIKENLYIYNCAKIKAYYLLDKENKLSKSLHVNEKEVVKLSLHLTIKELFNMNDYFTNSCLQEAKGIKKSNIELNKLYIENIKSNIKQREQKIKEITKKLKYNTTILNYIIDLSKSIKEGKIPTKLKKYIHIEFIKSDDEIMVYDFKKKIYYNLYDYEYIILRPYIKRLKNRLSKLEYGLNIQQNKLVNLNNRIKTSCFGSNKLFKSQFTLDEYKNNHTLWYKEYYNKRNKSLTVSGRKDAKQGNFSFRYNIINQELKFKTYNNKEIIINNIYFPYGQELIKTHLNSRIPITWSITDLGDYYIIKCMIDISIDKSKLNYSKADGVIGYDINYNHIAYSNIDKHGNLLSFDIIPYNLNNKSSEQANKIIEKAIIPLIEIANKYNKPLVGEKLNTEKTKSQLLYGNKKRNKALSEFAYQKIMTSIKSRAYKNNIEVYYINPAYTSIIGKIKYMRIKGISIHASASYVIGRRGMGFKEKLPKEYKKYVNINKHYWIQWNMLNKKLSNIETHVFYNKETIIDKLN